MTIENLNISLQQFENISNGHYNAGQIDLSIRENGTGKLVKINNHVTFTGSNNKTICNEKIVAIKECFIKALRDNGATEELINTIKQDIGLSYDVANNKQANETFINRRFTPLTRQQVKEYLDRFHGRVNQQDDVNQQVRQNVLNSIRSQRTDHSIITTSLSVLSGTPVTELVNQQGDLGRLLKDMSNIPSLMGEIFKNVSLLAGNENNGNTAPTNIYSNGKIHAQLAFSTVTNDQGDKILQAKLYYIAHDITPIEINFGVPTQEYLNALTTNLIDLIDIAPNVKDEDGISLGRKHLVNILRDISKKATADELGSSMPSILRDFSVEVIKKYNPDINQDSINVLKTDVLLAAAKSKLFDPDFDIPAFIQAKIEEINNLAAQIEEANDDAAVENNIEQVNLINQNNINNQELPNDNEENLNEVVNPNLLNNADVLNPAQGGNENHEDNVPVVNLSQQIPEKEQEKLIEEIMEVPLPPDPATIQYVPLASIDPKDMTSVANQIATTFDADNKVDFPALKNILSNNADLILGFLSGHVDYGKFSFTNAQNQIKTVFPFFNKTQIKAILTGVIDSFTANTGIKLDLNNMNVGSVDAFKLYLENQLSEKNLSSVINNTQIFITLNEMYSKVKKDDIAGVAASLNEFTKDASGYQTIKIDEIKEPLKEYVKAEDLNKFLGSLAALGKGKDQNAIKDFILQNSTAFLTFLSGIYKKDSAIDMVYRDAFEEIRPAVCKLLANRTGLYKLIKPNPDITSLTGFELKKLLKALEHPATVHDIATLISPVPESLNTFHKEFSSNVNVPATKTKEQEPSNLHNVDSKSKVKAKDDSGIVIKPLKVLAREKMGVLPSSSFIKAEDNAVRDVASLLMSITKTGNNESKKAKLLSLMSSNLKSFIYAVNNKDYLKSCLVPQMQNMVDDIHGIMKTTLEGLLKAIPTHTFKVDNLSLNDYNLINSFFRKVNDSLKAKPKLHLTQAESSVLDKAIADTLKAVDAKIPEVVDKARVEFQNFINQVFNIDPKSDIPHPYLKMTPAEIAKSLKGKSVDQILEEARFDSNRPGMLAFYLTVIKDYFNKLPIEEIAKIFTSALEAKPADKSQGEFTIDGNKRLLEAMFRGAGPLFQKMIQGMDKRLADKSYGDVFDSMKSNLQSLDKKEVQDILDTELNALKNKNPKNAVLQSADLIIAESMGSATVAETFKCVMVYKVPEGKSKVPTKNVTETVVVKVMRPGVSQRVLNEKSIFDEAAKKVPGVMASWNSQIESIKTEFNFTNEAENIKLGKNVYQVQGIKKSVDLDLAPNVNSMERVDIIPPSENILVLKMADGKPFDKEYNSIKAKLFSSFSKVFKTNPDTGEWITDKNGLPVMKDNIDPESIFSAKESTTKLLDDLFVLNDLLKQISGKWIKEALFNSGVFHNDMHGGNMMVDFSGDNNRKLTVIDYGNLMSLKPEERKMVKNLLVYTSLGQTDKFISVLCQLMKPTPNKAELEKLNAIVSTIMVKGSPTKDAGYRFTCILEEIRKLGLNLPPQIYSVTQGLNRLQTSLDDTALLIGKVKILYQALMGDVKIQPAQSLSEGVSFFEGTVFTDLSNVIISKGKNHDEIMKSINQANDKLKSDSFSVELESKFMHDAFNGNFKSTELFFKEYGDLLGFPPQLRKLINQAKDVFAKAQKDGFKYEDLDKLKTLSSKSPDSLSADDKKLLETGNKLKEAGGIITGQIKAYMSNRLADMPHQARRNSKIEPFETISFDPKTKEPDDVFTNYTFYLEEVIGDVVSNVKSTLGTKALLGGMGIFGGIKALTNGFAQMLKSDGPGGHVKQEIKL